MNWVEWRKKRDDFPKKWNSNQYTMALKWIASKSCACSVLCFSFRVVIVVEFYNIKPPHNDVSACNIGRDIRIITCWLDDKKNSTHNPNEVSQRQPRCLEMPLFIVHFNVFYKYIFLFSCCYVYAIDFCELWLT